MDLSRSLTGGGAAPGSRKVLWLTPTLPLAAPGIAPPSAETMGPPGTEVTVAMAGAEGEPWLACGSGTMLTETGEASLEHSPAEQARAGADTSCAYCLGGVESIPQSGTEVGVGAVIGSSSVHATSSTCSALDR